MPPIPQAVAQAYRDLVYCVGALRTLFVVVVLITLAFETAEILLLPSSPEQPSLNLLARFVSGLAQGFLVVPYYIAVHRLIILGEQTTSYALAPSDPRFQHFFWWWAAFSAATFLPMFLLAMLPQARAMAPLPHLFALALMLIVFVAIIITTLRLTIIFPAVAVDAPGANWQNVMADTKGYVWRIFLFGLLAGLPLIVPILILVALAAIGTTRGSSWIFGPLTMIFGAVLSVLAMTLFIIVASRLYLWIGNRVKLA
jgi:hypothetical protein